MARDSRYIICISCSCKCGRPKEENCRSCIHGCHTYDSAIIRWPASAEDLENSLMRCSAQIIYIVFKSQLAMYMGINSRRLETYAEKHEYKVVGIGKHSIFYNYYTIKNPLCFLCDGMFYSDGLIENLDSLTGAIDDTLKAEGVINRITNPRNSDGLTHLLIHPSVGIDNVADSVIGKLSEVWPEGAKKLVIVDSYFYHPYTRDNESVKDLFGNIMSRFHERGLDKVGVVCSSRSTGNQSDFTAIASSHGISLTTLKNTDEFHDRFWYFPDTDKGIIVGTSLNGLNRKYCLTEVLDGNDVRDIESVVNNLP